MPTRDEWNAVRFRDDARRGHVESWFVKLGSPDGRRALWLKATILRRAGGDTVAEAWAVAFDRDAGHAAAKEVVPIGTTRLPRERLEVRVASLALDAGHVRGSVASGGTRIAFDLRFDAGGDALVPLPFRAMYDGPFPRSKLVSPYPDSIFTGHYEVDGARVDVAGWRGMEGHNWGDRHTELYAWGHCNQWDGDAPFVLEGISARVKVGPAVLPPLTALVVRADGVEHAFTSPRAIATTRGEIGLRSWRFEARQGGAHVKGALWAATEDFVGLAYESPDGAITQCLNSKIARGRVRLELPGRTPVDVTTTCAALEVGTKDPAHGVAMRL